MAIDFTYQTGGKPTPKEAEFWDHQFRALQYQPPDPTATSQARHRGWGFEPWLVAPPDCHDFVIANLKRSLGIEQTDRFRPNAKFSIVAALSAYFAWLRTPEGSRWLLHLYGIQMLDPHPGFAYYYQGERLVEPQFGIRIYLVDRSARTAKAPCDYSGRALLGRLTDILASRRRPSHAPLPQIPDKMWCAVGDFLRHWLIERDPDTHWPSHKPDRISGYQWARGLLWPGQNDHVWTVISKAEQYVDDNRIYRIQRPAYEERLAGGVLKQVPPQNPGVLWTDRKEMHIVPLHEVDRNLGVAPAMIEAKYRCRSCDQIRCCTTNKGGTTNDRLCMSCRGTQLESGERKSFHLCQRRECRNCPDHLRNDEERITLISRLNLSSERVRRP
jgi:hypothetical protein